MLTQDLEFINLQLARLADQLHSEHRDLWTSRLTEIMMCIDAELDAREVDLLS